MCITLPRVRRSTGRGGDSIDTSRSTRVWPAGYEPTGGGSGAVLAFGGHGGATASGLLGSRPFTESSGVGACSWGRGPDCEDGCGVTASRWLAARPFVGTWRFCIGTLASRAALRDTGTLLGDRLLAQRHRRGARRSRIRNRLQNRSRAPDLRADRKATGFDSPATDAGNLPPPRAITIWRRGRPKLQYSRELGSFGWSPTSPHTSM